MVKSGFKEVERGVYELDATVLWDLKKVNFEVFKNKRK